MKNESKLLSALVVSLFSGLLSSIASVGVCLVVGGTGTQATGFALVAFVLGFVVVMGVIAEEDKKC